MAISYEQRNQLEQERLETQLYLLKKMRGPGSNFLTASQAYAAISDATVPHATFAGAKDNE